jgi:hypothetical protein
MYTEEEKCLQRKIKQYIMPMQFIRLGFQDMIFFFIKYSLTRSQLCVY